MTIKAGQALRSTGFHQGNGQDHGKPQAAIARFRPSAAGARWRALNLGARISCKILSSLDWISWRSCLGNWTLHNFGLWLCELNSAQFRLWDSCQLQCSCRSIDLIIDQHLCRSVQLVSFALFIASWRQQALLGLRIQSSHPLASTMSIVSRCYIGPFGCRAQLPHQVTHCANVSRPSSA